VKKHYQNYLKYQSIPFASGEEITKGQSTSSWKVESVTTETMLINGSKAIRKRQINGKRLAKEMLGNRYVKIIEENKMQFPNYINVAHESADIELGGDYNDEEDNESSSKK
jgi:Fe-S cluster biosynthesis and repair protein YggX